MNVHTLDLKFRQLPECIAAFLVESEGELALIETGPTSCLEACLAGIREAGFDPAEIRKVLVTHVHLDHSGAAGWWAGQGAQVYAHPRAARHLIDPTRLLQGAAMVYGDALQSLWGDVLPIDEKKVNVLEDGDTVTIGTTKLTAWDTPGHAFHHHAYLTEDGAAFVGDVAGVRLPGRTFISPTTAPSQFDPESYVASIRRLRGARLNRMYLTHFGVVDDVEDHLARYEQLIPAIASIGRGALMIGANQETLREIVTEGNLSRSRREGLSEEDWLRYEAANPSAMCADGVYLYLQREEDKGGG